MQIPVPDHLELKFWYHLIEDLEISRETNFQVDRSKGGGVIAVLILPVKFSTTWDYGSTSGRGDETGLEMFSSMS